MALEAWGGLCILLISVSWTNRKSFEPAEKMNVCTCGCSVCECAQQEAQVGETASVCGRQMVTQWSCSPSLSLWFPSGSYILPLVTSPKSYLIFFFPSLPHLFRPRLHPLSPDLDLHSPCRPLSFLCLSLSSPPQLHLCLFFADDINLKISRDFFLSVILDPVDTAQRTLKRFGDLSGGQKGGNSKEKTDRYDQQTNLSQNCLENID